MCQNKTWFGKYNTAYHLHSTYLQWTIDAQLWRQSTSYYIFFISLFDHINTIHYCIYTCIYLAYVCHLFVKCLPGLRISPSVPHRPKSIFPGVLQKNQQTQIIMLLAAGTNIDFAKAGYKDVAIPYKTLPSKTLPWCKLCVMNSQNMLICFMYLSVLFSDIIWPIRRKNIVMTYKKRTKQSCLFSFLKKAWNCQNLMLLYA